MVKMVEVLTGGGGVFGDSGGCVYVCVIGLEKHVLISSCLLLFYEGLVA